MLAQSAANRRNADALIPPTFDGTGEVVTVDVDNILLVQVLELNEQFNANWKMAPSVPGDDILANVAKTVKNESLGAASSVEHRRGRAKEINSRHTPRMRIESLPCIVECVDTDKGVAL